MHPTGKEETLISEKIIGINLFKSKQHHITKAKQNKTKGLSHK